MKAGKLPAVGLNAPGAGARGPRFRLTPHKKKQRSRVPHTKDGTVHGKRARGAGTYIMYQFTPRGRSHGQAIVQLR